MDVIDENGVLYVTSWTKSVDSDTRGRMLPIGVRPFYYDKVLWIDTLKFVFGSYDNPGGLDAMIEVSCGGVAASKLQVNGRVSIDKLIQKYKEKLVRHRATCGEQVVENFKSKFTIQLWQTKLWAL